jgi:hypothetical protein
MKYGIRNHELKLVAIDKHVQGFSPNCVPLKAFGISARHHTEKVFCISSAELCAAPDEAERRRVHCAFACLPA